MDDRELRPAELPVQRTDADRDAAGGSPPEDRIGEAAGSVSGALTGAAIGSAGGPVGTVIGAVAGAIGGWWAGHAIAESASRIDDEDETYFREHFETAAFRPPEWDYDRVRPAYHLGYLASQNPEYVGRKFEEIEPDLERGWNADARTRYGDWADYRPYAERGYARGGPELVETHGFGDGTSVTGYAIGLQGEASPASDIRTAPDDRAASADVTSEVNEAVLDSTAGTGEAGTFADRAVTNEVAPDADRVAGEAGMDRVTDSIVRGEGRDEVDRRP